MEKESQPNGCRQSQTGIAEELPQTPGSLLHGLPIGIQGRYPLPGQILVPHILNVDVFYQLVQGHIEVVAEQDQSLKIRVGLTRFP